MQFAVSPTGASPDIFDDQPYSSLNDSLYAYVPFIAGKQESSAEGALGVRGAYAEGDWINVRLGSDSLYYAALGVRDSEIPLVYCYYYLVASNL